MEHGWSPQSWSGLTSESLKKFPIKKNMMNVMFLVKALNLAGKKTSLIWDPDSWWFFNHLKPTCYDKKTC